MPCLTSEVGDGLFLVGDICISNRQLVFGLAEVVFQYSNLRNQIVDVLLLAELSQSLVVGVLGLQTHHPVLQFNVSLPLLLKDFILLRNSITILLAFDIQINNLMF